MTADTSFWSYIINAGFVVKCVMLILLFASIASWTIIIERWRFFKKLWDNTHRFQDRFWSGVALNDLYQDVSKQSENKISLSSIFSAGFQTFSKTRVLDSTERSMRSAENDLLDRAESPLSLLATIGSVSPFIGLFGTVWGIMTAFQALGAVQQASIAVVAPSISEALIATAFGLFAAIPAVVAFNRFTQQVSRLQTQTENFSSEMMTILQRASDA